MPLIFVPTPLGNLRDVTLRAIDVLKAAEIVVAEDTRVARRLLGALQIEGREIWSYREQNAQRVTAGILERARTGIVAVTTDAGTPGISDPGSDLVGAARQAGIPVEVLPGPSAAIGIALLSGFPLRRFSFEGFPPRGASARREHFAAALKLGITTIWYESPQRIAKTLADLAAVAPDARIVLVREFTKLHEQQLWGTPESVAAQLPDPPRGEIAFAIAPYAAAPAAHVSNQEAESAIDALLEGGQRIGEVAKQLAMRGFGDRRELYVAVAARKAARKAPVKQR
jgi:16S rRNA (cytidine1402-2'-O)-methyltransferase